jgi:hypothetical protein
MICLCRHSPNKHSYEPRLPVRLLKRSFILIGIPALLSTVALTSCEDDPILAPQSGGSKTNGSYGNIAVAPPVDTVSAPDRAADNLPTNPEVF